MSVSGIMLGPYELTHRLRDSQVGESFVAKKSGPYGFEKRVVIRCADRALLDTVIGEAKGAARLSHSGIAHALDAGTFEDVCYVASEYVPGVTLGTLLLQRGKLPWRGVARVVRDIAAALAYTHARRDQDGRLLGIVHRRSACQVGRR